MKRILLFAMALLLGLQAFAQNKMFDIKYYRHVYVPSKVNGQDALLIFDTGAPYTCLDSIYRAQSPYKYTQIGNAKMGGTGNNEQKVKIIIRELTYTAGDKQYTSEVSPIFQLKQITGDAADGLMGISDLGGVVIAIDYKNKKMGFWDKVSEADIKGYTPIAIRHANNRIYVPLSITVDKDRTIQGEFLMDLGSGGTISFTSAVAAKHNLQNIKPQLPYNMAVGGIGGSSSACDFRAQSASVGGFKLENITVKFSQNTGGALSDREYLGIVGNEFWERFDLIIDLPNKKLYLRPNADFNKPFDAPTRGFAYTDRSKTLGYWVVNCLYRDSNAEKAGLKNGDHILSVNGKDVKTISMDEQQTFFKNLKSVTLEIERDGAKSTVSFSFDDPKI